MVFIDTRAHGFFFREEAILAQDTVNGSNCMASHFGQEAENGSNGMSSHVAQVAVSG